jgi:hypothetical protein
MYVRNIGKFFARAGLAFLSLILSHVAFLVAHATGWYPDQQLATLIMLSPETSSWIALLVATSLVWSLLDWIFYRRQSAVENAAQHPVAPVQALTATENEGIPIVPLYEAARRTYDEVKDTRGGKIARGLNNNPEKIIRYYAYALAAKIPIYGTPALSKYVRKIDLKLGSSAIRIEFRNGIACAVSSFADGLENADNLFVYESDLDRGIEIIKTTI